MGGAGGVVGVPVGQLGQHHLVGCPGRPLKVPQLQRGTGTAGRGSHGGQDPSHTRMHGLGSGHQTPGPDGQARHCRRTCTSAASVAMVRVCMPRRGGACSRGLGSVRVWGGCHHLDRSLGSHGGSSIGGWLSGANASASAGASAGARGSVSVTVTPCTGWPGLLLGLPNHSTGGVCGAHLAAMGGGGV